MFSAHDIIIISGKNRELRIEELQILCCRNIILHHHSNRYH